MRTGIPGSYLALAAALHLLVLALWPMEKGQPGVFPSAPRLDIRLTRPVEVEAPTGQEKAEFPKREGSPPGPRPREDRGVTSEIPAPAIPAYNGQPEAREFRQQATALIREESRRRGMDPMYQAPAAARQPGAFDRLALAGAREERRYADGLVKIRNPDGSTYCMRPPPKADGPVELMALPSSCP